MSDFAGINRQQFIVGNTFPLGKFLENAIQACPNLLAKKDSQRCHVWKLQKINSNNSLGNDGNEAITACYKSLSIIIFKLS